MSVTGTGTQASPWVVSAAITTLTNNGDGTVTYVNEVGTPSTFDVCQLLIDGGCIDINVGSLSYDPISGVITLIETDGTVHTVDIGPFDLCATINALPLGTAVEYVSKAADGSCVRALVPAVPTPTPITVVDTATVNLTSSGVDGHTIQADVNIASPGCGLVATGAGINGLRVNTLPWVYPCADTNGVPVICDAAGNLRAAPEHTCVQSGRNGAGQNFPGFGPGQGFGAAVSATINNPSPCRSMVVNADYTVGINIAAAFASSMTVYLRVIQGISYAGLYGMYGGNPGTLADNVGTSTITIMNSDIGTLAAGGSLTVSIEAGLDLNGPSAQVSMSATAMLWGCTQ